MIVLLMVHGDSGCAFFFFFDAAAGYGADGGDPC